MILSIFATQAFAGASAAALSGALSRLAIAAEEALQTRPVPSSGERLPIIGIGTAVIFDFENDAAKFGERREVLKTLAAGGGKLIDTAHSYGRAEDRLGQREVQLGVLARVGREADLAGATAVVERPHHVRMRVRLHRVEQAGAGGQAGPQHRSPLPQHGQVIHVQWCAVPRCQFAQPAVGGRSSSGLSAHRWDRSSLLPARRARCRRWRWAAECWSRLAA